ncbi:MAG: phage tail protein [Deltaproteobacteria bacterium]|nr:phage tail protein [Deltaproteobacteria bacterium]
MDVTLKKGVMRKDSYLLNWIGTVKLNTVDKRDITVSLMDDEDKPVVTWKVIDAFPSKLEAPTFDASANEIAVETLTLVASDLKIEYH